MTVLTIARALHVLGLVLWLGSAAVDILLEVVLLGTATPDAQAALIRLHRLVDLVIEGPAIVLALAGGAWLVEQTWGFSFSMWPTWLRVKIVTGAAAALANLVCVGFVLARANACARCAPGASPFTSPSVRSWSRCVLATGVGVPFAIVAFYLGVAHT
jgi:hypothetical protein